MANGEIESGDIKPLLVMKCDKDAYSLGFSDQEAFVGDNSGNIYCFKLNSQNEEPFRKWKGHHGSVFKLDCGLDRLFSASEDGKIISWKLSNIRSEEETVPEKYFLEHQGWVFTLKVQGDLLLSGSKDHTARIYDISSEAALEKPSIKVLDGHTESLTFISVQENLAFTGSTNGTFYIWDLTKPQRIDNSPIRVFKAHDVTTFACTILNNRNLLSISWGSDLKAFAPLDASDLRAVLLHDDITILLFNQILNGDTSDEEYKEDVKGLIFHLKQNFPIETLKRLPLLEIFALRFKEEIINFYFETMGLPQYPFLSQLIKLYMELKLKKNEDLKNPAIKERASIAAQVKLTLDFIIEWVSIQMKINLTKTEEIFAQEPQYLFQLLVDYGLSSGAARNLIVISLKQEILQMIGELKKNGKKIKPITGLAMRYSGEIVEELMSIPTKPKKLKIWNSRYKIDIKNGSPHSVTLFRMIQMLSDAQRREFDEIIAFKWQNIKNFIRVHAILFWTQLVLFNWFLYGEKNFFLIPPLIFFNCYFLFYEIKSWISGRGYTESLFNWIDLLLVLTLFVIIAMNVGLSGMEGRFLPICNFFSSSLINIRGITYLRAFDSLRYLIEMVLKIYSDIRAFLVIMLIFGLIYSVGLISIDSILVRNDTVYLNKLKIAANLALGSWDEIPEYWTSWDWAVFLVSTITFSVILLNLIIAIVSRTFEEFYSDKLGIDREIKLGLIVEIDDFLRMGDLKINPVLWKKNSVGFQAIEEMQEVVDLEKLKNQVLDVEKEILKKIDQKVEMKKLKLSEKLIASDARIMDSMQKIQENNENRLREMILSSEGKMLEVLNRMEKRIGK